MASFDFWEIPSGVNKYRYTDLSGLFLKFPALSQPLRANALRQVKVTTTPLFARYVFVLADQAAQQTIHTIRSTRGVDQLIKVGEQPTLVKASIIDKIKALETGHLSQVKQYFTSNDKVVISQGICHRQD